MHLTAGLFGLILHSWYMVNGLKQHVLTLKRAYLFNCQFKSPNCQLELTLELRLCTLYTVSALASMHDVCIVLTF